MIFEASLDYARSMDKTDPLHQYRSQFYFPAYKNEEAIYFCGNSLGLQPRNARIAIEQELNDWKNLAVGGYFKAKTPWLFYQQYFRSSLSAIMGCRETEVTVMNALTVNLHLLMLSFYQPAGGRYKIMMEAGAFPSDQYAVETQVKFYGYQPEDAIIEIAPREGEHILHTEDILKAIDENKDSLALTLFGGVNYYTGQLYDIAAITKAAHAAGAVAGFDLAHVAGNVPVQLHDWDVDFAAWCSYKYLNGGPGAVGGIYIHEKYGNDPEQRRMAGWWGNDERVRFKMEKGFIPQQGAGGWQLSTAQVFNMVSLKASLKWFDVAGIHNLRAKSLDLTAYLEFLLKQLRHLDFEIITPSDPQQRGAQLSLYFKEFGKEVHQKMIDNCVIVDYREPGVIRIAPAPLYNSYEDVYQFYKILRDLE